MELLSEWEYQNYELPEDHLHFLMGIYNQLGQAEKAIAFINSIPKKSKSTYNSIQMQTLAIFSYNLLGNSQKADEMFHKTFELYQTYTR
jgi:tetratricopeptide (TPR) repeat protein